MAASARKRAPRRPTLAEVVDVLQEIAPLELAADWDNVGLVVDPRDGGGDPAIARVLLTIDLTSAVVAEALRARAALVVAYHPPLFHGHKRLAADDPRQRAALQAFAAGIPVYSPHTALDAAPGGVADWLCEGLTGGDAPAAVHPLGDGEFGRLLELAAPTTLGALLPRIKAMLGTASLRLALTSAGPRHKVRRVAVAAGAGGSILRAARADLWLTGELSHHEALAAVAGGAAVVLGEHSNTERGYLQVLKKRLQGAFGRGLDVRVARADRDPFTLA
ncbi:MAG: Nif3-like dinuclear metal center hexameric protein [Planctomycetota bacterium]